MTTKKWVQTTLFLAFSTLITIGGFNYFMDPLWCFSHQNSLQSHQESFNERQQKLNLMHFNDFHYDGLFLGSSRVTIHNPSTIKQGKTFNMALDAMRPYEFNEYVEYAKTLNKKEFEYIIIGLDFLYVGSNPNQFNIKSYLENTTSMGYRYKSLFSYDTLNRSIKNIKNSAFGRHKKRFKTYDQHHIAHAYTKEPQVVQGAIDGYMQSMSDTPFVYDRENYLKAIQELKKNNPRTKFVVFTTPLPEPLLEKILKSPKNRALLNTWLSDIHQEFGPFLHLFYSNTVTQNYTTYFADEAHYTSEVAECINHKIMGESCSNPAFDTFGIVVDRNYFNKSTTND
jgi:hypothetical protein